MTLLIILLIVKCLQGQKNTLRRIQQESEPADMQSWAYEACMLHSYPTECSLVVADFNLKSITNDPALVSGNLRNIQDWAEKVVGYYCCKLRSGEMEELTRIVFEFPETCFHKRVKDALEFAVLDGSEKNLWVDLMLYYCPNVVVPEAYQSKSHFMELFRVSIESKSESSETLKERVIHDCKQGISNGDDLVDLTILFPEGNGGDWQHVVAFWGDEISNENFIDWMPQLEFSAWWTLITQSEYSLLTGLNGYFQSPKKMKIEGGIRLSGLSKKAMLEKKKEIAKFGTYDIMTNNCAQQVARIAEAGLGCSIHDIPFLLPGSIEVVGAEIGHTLTQKENQKIQSVMNDFPEDSFLTNMMRRIFKALTGRRNLCPSKDCD